MFTVLIAAGSQRQVQDKTFFLGMLRFPKYFFSVYCFYLNAAFALILTFVIICWDCILFYQQENQPAVDGKV